MSSIAAACARSARAVSALRGARAFATETFASGSSSSATDFLPAQDRTGSSARLRQQANVSHHDVKSIYVRAWDDISTMPEFFAILRGVERRFGTVKEFRVGRVSCIHVIHFCVLSSAIFTCHTEDQCIRVLSQAIRNRWGSSMCQRSQFRIS
ncbi:hypothetical protein BD310DRAFT_479332 [Dichomitus squalens]|uniref:Uncharacterized protein n=1 Tax=Dichomitus squalens TaxID=114155 RepID=A0A4V6MWT0_9APHY|nr:hypothetical protein BD310DRAFT_479332 [Dichomitus squalens]